MPAEECSRPGAYTYTAGHIVCLHRDKPASMVEHVNVRHFMSLIALWVAVKGNKAIFTDLIYNILENSEE